MTGTGVVTRGLTDAQAQAAREAVASVQEACGFGFNAERTRSGEGDQLPLLQSAFAAASAVLEITSSSASPDAPSALEAGAQDRG